MTHTLQSLAVAAGLIAAGASAAPACASDFTLFAADETICSQAGTDAIKGATGPEAAHRYDLAHWRCMAARGQARQMQAYRNSGPPRFSRQPDNSDFPDAYYAIPYATPGYGYDGFSY